MSLKSYLQGVLLKVKVIFVSSTCLKTSGYVPDVKNRNCWLSDVENHCWIMYNVNEDPRPGVNFINILCAPFSYLSVFAAFL